MKNRLIKNIGGLSYYNTASTFLAADTTDTTPRHHDSVMITTLVVKDLGRSLLIIPPETTSRPAEQGNTILPAVTRVFPVPYRSSKKTLQVRYSKSYLMSLS